MSVDSGAGTHAWIDSDRGFADILPKVEERVQARVPDQRFQHGQRAVGQDPARPRRQLRKRRRHIGEGLEREVRTPQTSPIAGSEFDSQRRKREVERLRSHGGEIGTRRGR